MGRVFISQEYVVDLDDEAMVEQAKDALLDDCTQSCKFDEFSKWLQTEEATGALGFSEADIPAFLRESAEERKEEVKNA